MRLFIKVLILIGGMAFIALAYICWTLHELTIDQANYMKTEAARANRWKPKENANAREEPVPEIEKTFQVQSGGTDQNSPNIQPENQNEKMD